MRLDEGLLMGEWVIVLSGDIVLGWFNLIFTRMGDTCMSYKKGW